MTDVSVIGLGLMGAALAHTLHSAGQKLTVWNRSGAKMKAFEDLGVACASDFQSAVEASDIVLICIDSYATMHDLLDGLDRLDLFKGKTVVHLSSGTPKEADSAARRFHYAGASYLDGAILAGPDDIGTASATLLLSGDTSAMERAQEGLNHLSDGGVRYLGPTVGAASALDLAWLMTRYCNFLAATHV
ncbi:MAG: NAD(P)-binding domain-containing protein, partial [Pseudomonadota bacterium]